MEMMISKLKSVKHIEGGSVRNFIISQIFIIFSLVAVIICSFVSFYKDYKESLIVANETTVAEVGSELHSFVEKGASLLISSAEAVSHMQSKGRPNREISEYLVHVTNSAQILETSCFNGFYGFINGKFIDGAGWVPPAGYNPVETDWYKNAVQADGKIAIIPVYKDAYTGKFIISLSIALADKKSVVSFDIILDEIQELAKNIVTEAHNQIFIIDYNGTVISNDENNILSSSEEVHSLLDRIKNNHEEKFDTRINSREVIVNAENVLDTWYITMITDKKELAKTVLGKLTPFVIALLIILLLTLYLCSSNFKARYQIGQYANTLNKNKSELEHQLVAQWNQLDKKSRNLVQMQEAVIEGMATVIEYRDLNTGMHVQNTKRYVMMITKYLYNNGLYPDEVNQRFVNIIGNAAAMHDIGKVAISDRILNKPGKLDPDEYEIMKNHTIIGAGLVRQVFGKSIDEDMLRMCIDVVQYHHEKWNGTGYPIGLIGEDIPLSARIMAIADVFDAIVSKRVYKDAVPVEEVFEIIRKDEGSHFDPELAEIFLSMQNEIKNYLASLQNK